MDTYALYRRLAAAPGGRRLFSTLFARKAPYFRTVRPQVRALAPHRAEVVVPKRRAVENHLGTVHAIAVCNGLEAAMYLYQEGYLRVAVLDGGLQRWYADGYPIEGTLLTPTVAPTEPSWTVTPLITATLALSVTQTPAPATATVAVSATLTVTATTTPQ